MRHVLVPHALLDADGVDDERVAFPAADRVTVEARLDVVERLLRPVHQDAAHLRIRLLDDRDLPAALQNLHRKHAVIIARHAVGQTGDGVVRERLSLGVRLPDRFDAVLPFLRVRWLQLWLRRRRGRLPVARCPVGRTPTVKP